MGLRQVLLFRRRRPLDALGARIYGIAATVAALTLPACAVLFWASERRVNPDIPTLGASFEWLLRTLIEQQSQAAILTAGGHVAYLLVVFSGLTLVGTGTGAIASHLFHLANERRTGIVTETLRSQHYVVCGWNSRGTDVLRELTGATEPGESANEVVVVASLAKKPFIGEEDLAAVEFVQGDPRSKDALRRAGVERARGVIVLSGDEGAVGSEERSVADAVTLLTALVVKGLAADAGNRPYITAEVLSGDATSHFRDNGINYVTHSEILPAMLARDVTENDLVGIVRDLLSVAGNDLYVDPAPGAIVGSSFGAAMERLKRERDVVLLGVRTGEGAETQTRLNPPTDHVIPSDARLVYLAERRVDWGIAG